MTTIEALKVSALLASLDYLQLAARAVLRNRYDATAELNLRHALDLADEAILEAGGKPENLAARTEVWSADPGKIG